MSFRILIVVTLFGFCSAAFAAPSVQIRDWFAYCKISLQCEMFVAQSTDGVYTFGFSRGPKGNAPLELFLSVAGELSPTSQVHINLRGDTGERFTFDVASASLRDNLLYFKSPETNAKLLEAMMKGSALELQYQTDEGGQSAVLSLSGVTGSALFLDEAQGRLGRMDALKEKGSKPAKDAVSNARELNSNSQLPEKVVQEWFAPGSDCNAGFEEIDDVVAEYGAVEIDVDENARIYILPCGGPGAYNFPQTLVIHDASNDLVRTLGLPIMGEKGPTIMYTPYNAGWDPTQSKLSAFFKARGLGDCGSIQTWNWRGGYYSNFQLVEARFKDECDGSTENWTVTWPK